MDPVTHTLTGWALAETGLKRRTALGTATLVLGANVPDVDVLAYLVDGPTALWFRRGLTHGLPAMVVWPVVLAGVMLAWDRTVRRRGATAADGRWLLGLSAIAVLSHPVLDFLNVYGMRWLMPFSPRWWYGDALFIVDPWAWALLAGGIYAARRGRRPPRARAGAPASLALGLVAAYALAMAASAVWARGFAVRDVRERFGAAAAAVMVAPRAVDPFRRWVVAVVGEEYRFGEMTWLPAPSIAWSPLAYQRTVPHPAVAAAARDPTARKFLAWARFPYAVVAPRADHVAVHIADLRYTLDPAASWAAVTVTVPR